MNMRLADILLVLSGRFLHGQEDMEISGVSTDSRLTKPGDLFFALVAERNGHVFVQEAVRRGAVAAVVSEEVNVDVPLIMVPDTLAALGALARVYRLRFDIPVVAVTGSVGKTTTKEMIARVLERKYSVLTSEKNFNNDIGVPLTLLRLDSNHTAAVLELAMRAVGEIRRLTAIARPRIGIVTNTGLSHIELLGSQEAIAAAKTELLEDLPSEGLAVLNRDDEFYELMRLRRFGRTVSFGVHESSTIRATDIRVHPDGRAGATIVTQKGVMELDLAVVGQHNVWNAMAAIAVGIEMGVSLDDAKAALELFRPPQMRANVVHAPDGYSIIDDTYNAGPASTESAVRTLGAMEGGRRIAILGDMLELGAYSEDAHTHIGRVVAELQIDVLITVGDMARRIAKGAIDNGFSEGRVHGFESSDEVASALKPELKENDLILVKGSRSMKMELVVEGLLSE